MKEDRYQYDESLETLKEVLFDTDQVESVVENAFTKNLDIDGTCDYITSKLFKKSVQRIYCFYNFSPLKINNKKLNLMDDDFSKLLSKLLKIYFVSYSEHRDRGKLMLDLKGLDNELVSFLRKNAKMKISYDESSFSIVFKNLISRMLSEDPDIDFLKDTHIKDYNSKILDLMRSLFLQPDFLNKYDQVYKPMLHTNMIVFNFSKFFNAAKLLSKTSKRFTLKRFENLCETYSYLSEFYAKIAKLLYCLILIQEDRQIPDIKQMKRYTLGEISRKILIDPNFEILGLKTPQIRNAINHETYHYDKTRNRCTFDDGDHDKPALVLSPNEFEKETKELFALVISVSRVANFSTIFYFLLVKNLFDKVET
jgi:hypothetical protein